MWQAPSDGLTEDAGKWPLTTSVEIILDKAVPKHFHARLVEAALDRVFGEQARTPRTSVTVEFSELSAAAPDAMVQHTTCRMELQAYMACDTQHTRGGYPT